MTLQKLSIKFNANTAQFDLRVKGKKTELRDPDAGPITALLAIGDQEFRNTQDWRLAEQGKKLITPREGSKPTGAGKPPVGLGVNRIGSPGIFRGGIK